MRRVPLVLLASLSWLPGCGGPAEEEVYPSQPIKVVVPFGAGGGTDSFARIVEQAIEENDLLPQPLVIVNLGGAGGTIGSRRVKNAAPDGYTVMVLHNAILTAKFTRLVDYGPEAFEPVAATGFVGQVVAVWDKPDSPRDLDELLERARERPGELRWACNLGALTHFSGLQLEQSQKADGARFNFVPSGGGADRFADLKGGHVDVTGFSLEEYTRYKSDGLRGLCFLGGERYPGLDLPTAAELGYEEAVRDNLFYWWMPKGTPPDRIEAFADVLEEMMALPQVQEKLRNGRIDPVFVRGDAMRAKLAAAEERNAAIAVPPNPSLPDFPWITLWIVVTLTVAVFVREVVRLARAHTLPAPEPAPEPVAETLLAETQLDEAALDEAGDAHVSGTAASTRIRVDLAVGILVAVTVYAGLLSKRLIDFRLVTIGFVLVAGGLLVGRNSKLLAGLAVLAVALSLGVQAVFTHVFEIVLP